VREPEHVHTHHIISYFIYKKKHYLHMYLCMISLCISYQK